MSTNDELILEVAARAIVVNPEGKILILREADEKGYAEGTNSGRYHGAVAAAALSQKRHTSKAYGARWRRKWASLTSR